ncbi:Hypothetical predicted protein, partial [Paramuricea clavata]
FFVTTCLHLVSSSGVTILFIKTAVIRSSATLIDHNVVIVNPCKREPKSCSRRIISSRDLRSMEIPFSS